MSADAFLRSSVFLSATELEAVEVAAHRDRGEQADRGVEVGVAGRRSEAVVAAVGTLVEDTDLVVVAGAFFVSFASFVGF